MDDRLCSSALWPLLAVLALAPMPSSYNRMLLDGFLPSYALWLRLWASLWRGGKTFCSISEVADAVVLFLTHRLDFCPIIRTPIPRRPLVLYISIQDAPSCDKTRSECLCCTDTRNEGSRAIAVATTRPLQEAAASAQEASAGRNESVR